MKNTTITAVYRTKSGLRVKTGFTSIAKAEEWRSMVDDGNPGYFSEWSIDTTPYDYPEVFHVCEEVAA